MVKVNKHDIMLIESVGYLVMSWVDFLRQDSARISVGSDERSIIETNDFRKSD